MRKNVYNRNIFNCLSTISTKIIYNFLGEITLREKAISDKNGEVGNLNREIEKLNNDIKKINNDLAATIAV